MSKKIFISILLVGILTALLYSQSNRNYINMNDITKKRTVALASFRLKESMTNKALDKLKYFNVELYSEYIVNSFISNFNSTNSFITLVPLKSVLSKNAFNSLPSTYPLDSEYVAPLGYIATNNVPDNVLEDLQGKVDSIMFADVTLSFWAQKIFINFSMYDLDRELIWRDTFEGESKYIIGDNPLSQDRAYSVILEQVAENEKKHEAGLYRVIDESISNSIYNISRKFPMVFDTNEYFRTVETFSLTNENYKKEANLLK